MSTIYIILTVLANSVTTLAQVTHHPFVGTFSEADSAGITVKVQQNYRDAVNIGDSSKCVFKQGKEKDSLIHAYCNFLQDFGKYLKKNNFKWDAPAKGKDRIYFNADGYVDYFLFNFKTEISDEKLIKFKQLLLEFVKTHKIGISAPERFAQCSPFTFMDK